MIIPKLLGPYYDTVDVFQIIQLNTYVWTMLKNLASIFLWLLYCHKDFIDIFYPYEHSPKGLAEVFLFKKISLLLDFLFSMLIFLPLIWIMFFLHTTVLLILHPTMLNVQTPHELFSSRTPDLSHIRIFGCQIWVLIFEPKRHTISPYRQEDIYILNLIILLLYATLFLQPISFLKLDLQIVSL